MDEKLDGGLEEDVRRGDTGPLMHSSESFVELEKLK
jgi:hypothetical protein